MDKFNKLYESVTKTEPVAEVKELMDRIKSAYMKEFPKGWMNIKINKGLGDPSLYMMFGIQPEEKWSSKIKDNDPGLQQMFVYGVTDKEITDKIEADLFRGGSLTVKPEEGSHMAFGRVKFGWRKKKGSIEQIEKHLVNYFKKMRKVVDENKDNLSHDID